MVSSGFTLVRTGNTGTITAGDELFGSNNPLAISAIQGTGTTPNIVTVTTTIADNGYEEGQRVNIAGVTTQTDYNLDKGVLITEKVSLNTFKYSTTNHTNSSADSSGTTSITDPFILPDNTPDTVPFIHLTLGLDANSKVTVTRDNSNYVLIANDESLVGDIFRSFTFRKGDLFNVKFLSTIDVEFAYLLVEE